MPLCTARRLTQQAIALVAAAEPKRVAPLQPRLHVENESKLRHNDLAHGSICMGIMCNKER